MNLDKARQTQRAVDAAYAPVQLTPLPDVVEDNSEEAWAAWDRAVEQQEKQ